MGAARLKTIGLHQPRLSCFFLACLIYGVFGSPTPNSPGFIEITVGALLIFAVGGAGCGYAVRCLTFREDRESARGAAFLAYGLTFPLLAAFLSGHALSAIVRDLLPFLFLFCPLFFAPLFSKRRADARVVLWCLIAIGLFFSLRSLAMQAGMCGFLCADELLYLENMPTVLFACVFLIGAGMNFFMRGRGARTAIAFLSFLALAVVPFLALALSLQRASLGAVFVYTLIVLALHFYSRSKRAVAALGVLVGFIFFAGTLFPLADFPSAEILGKTALVGFNNRPQEAAAVWQAVAQNPLSLFFGLGWGAHFNSPAVGGLSVNFTHNFFTTMLLKTGLCGLIFSVVYIAGLIRVLARTISSDAVLGLALAAPFFIDILLYASFKSLDFGLTLLMISLSLLYSSQSESFQSSTSSDASSDHTFHEPGLSSRTRRDGAGFA